MKVVSLLASPRKNGNSSTIAKVIIDTLERQGAESVVYHLNDLSFRGCQACGACKTKNDKCILKDDLADVLESVHQADVLILATPVYWGEVSSQMKGFIDRTYSFLTPGFMTEEVKHRLDPGKKCIFIQTQGAPLENMFDDIFPRYNGFFKQLNLFEETYLIRGCGVNNPDDVQRRSDILQQAKDIAVTLLQEKQDGAK